MKNFNISNLEPRLLFKKLSQLSSTSSPSVEERALKNKIARANLNKRIEKLKAEAKEQEQRAITQGLDQLKRDLEALSPPIVQPVPIIDKNAKPLPPTTLEK